ncbi:non-homologous end-joining DNA ligase [Prosthecobacter sp.]|uniref:non-homologous end-joining DNA ligase n=1 Tax=Prosthecobacter sp. TaxID=1965333 RepID=UPI003784928D
MSLREYQKKRDFKKTAEPRGKKERRGGALRFVIQKHAASHLHYDFRLELDGTLKSWAVPKGVPYAKGEKRLAVEVEDHPLSYIHFEGPIPQGQYGGGTVMVWDTGTYEPASKTPLKELQGGKLHFTLHGKKLKGEWYLVRLHGKEGKPQWLLIRGGEDLKPVSKRMDDTSAISGRHMKDLADAEPWISNRSQGKGKDKLPPAHHHHEEEEEEEEEESSKKSSRAKKSAKGKAKTKSKSNAASAAADPASEDPPPASRAAMSWFVEPMKAKALSSPPTDDNWVYEVKFDGFRALAINHGRHPALVSRTEKDMTQKFPEITDALRELSLPDCVLDGEIVALDDKGLSSFQRLQAYDLGQERPPLCYYVFDLLRLKKRDLTGEPLLKRKEALRALLKGSDVIRYSDSLEGDVNELLKQAKKLGLEGLIGKRPESTYEVGRRSGQWVKLKLNREQEVVIGGYTDPTGSRKHIGALIIGVHADGKLQCAGKVGTGFDTEMLRTLHRQFQPLVQEKCPFANLPADTSGRWGQGITRSEMKKCTWLKPRLVCQVKFTEWTQDGRLRHPVFLGLRQDKRAGEVTRERIQES